MTAREDRPAARAPADFVVDFVNTRAGSRGRPERLGSEATLREWAAGHGLLGPGAVVTGADVVAARELREALRIVLLDHAAAPDLEPGRVLDAERRLREAGSRNPLIAVVTADRVEVVALAGGGPGVLAAVLAAAATAAQRGEWRLVKACCNPGCEDAFTDRTRNHAGRYCSPGCGSQVSMRAHRARAHRSGG